MREILFKAQRLDNGEWVEGNYVNGYTFSYILPIPMAMAQSGCAIVVNKATICQYTGLTDKNGNKIWENDIIKPYDTVTNEGYIIGWDNEMGAFVFCDINTNDSLYVLVGHYIESIQPVEVIGNIFDNSELLNTDNEASQQAHQEVLKPAT